MSINVIYYRFTHLSKKNDYFAMPANLRMQYLAKFKIKKSDFEMLCLAVARIASIINAIANVMRVVK